LEKGPRGLGDLVLFPWWSQLQKSAVPGLIRDHVRMNVSPDTFFLWFISEVAVSTTVHF